MADTTVKVDSETRDRLAALAEANGQSLRAYLATLAMEEQNQLRLRHATTYFRDAVGRPGLADAFAEAFPDDAPAGTGRTAA
ncbi:antitoxin MazE7 [Streptantibioticus silvisoli]|uniref:Antitoxin MazE7 n=1 Tax=Streptantibioticus silvisoli TaxID=2705255 RepID=A0ABT6VZL6_9ACTN|nr:antitoxin MazE7 [Streptantibioticus silvisoli]MDI5963469.1 antitoxin MazE7 [Streptantibioticus silvisoli]